MTMLSEPEPAPVGSTEQVPHRNEVVVVGRLSTAALTRRLPSGDLLMSWRIVVDRPPARRRSDARAQSVDVVDCIAWSARVRRSAGGWELGDVVELRGSLRRRFWRTAGGGLQSRAEVEVTGARRLSPVTRPLRRRRTRG